MIKVVFGIPGSGKTTYLLNEIEQIIQGGYEPKDVAYLTMSRNARAVARKRMAEKFGATKDDLQYFRTIHSICWEMIGRPKKITEKMISEFFKSMSIDYDPKMKNGGETYEMLNQKNTTLGGLYLNVYSHIRIKHLTDMNKLNFGEFNRIWVEECSQMVTNEQQLRATHDSIKAYNTLKKYQAFKYNEGVIDFEDMLMMARNQRDTLPTKILIVDEFQDLSPLMYELYRQWKKGKDHVIIAGDDDQSIYTFLGAHPAFLLQEGGTAENVITLSQSYRCPQVILNYASETIRRNTNRYEKEAISTKQGGVISEAYIGRGGLKRIIRPKTDTMILARTNYYVKVITEKLMGENIPFRMVDSPGSWSDKFIHTLNAVVKLTTGSSIDDLSILEFRALVDSLPSTPYLRRGVKKTLKEVADIDRKGALGLGFFTLHSKTDFTNALKLTKQQTQILRKWGLELVDKIYVRVGTIHSAKGDEADDVFVQTLLPKRTIQMMKDKDAMEEERRVRYVALTRAKKRVVLLRNNQPNDIRDF